LGLAQVKAAFDPSPRHLKSHIYFYNFGPLPLGFLHRGQVLHQEDAPFRGFDQGHGVLQHGSISAVPGQLDSVALQVLHQVRVKAAHLQELGGLVSSRPSS